MRPRTVALVGTTASGKSQLAMAVARRRADVELVCVDSMTVYRAMDIGTAKPQERDRRAVPHHLLDLVEPSEEFTVRQFQRAARAAMAGIAGRGHRALLVGGTGLYLRAVVDELEIPERFGDVAAALEREADEPGGVEALHARLTALDPVAAARTTGTNRRRIVRALEVTIGSGRAFSSYGPGLEAYPPSPVTLVGLPYVPELVDRRIEERFARWLDEGLLEEVRRLAAHPGGLSRTARQALGYKELLTHVLEGTPLDECVEQAVRRTRVLARRQWAWFKRDPRIRWIRDGEDPIVVVNAALDGAPLLHDPPPAGARLSSMLQPSGRRPLEAMKLEAAGNDFLVVLGAAWPTLLPRQVRALCDRRRGVGADGIIVARKCPPGSSGAELQMELYNADGSSAEMSGNGIRCLVHAASSAGLVGTGAVRVATASGLRTVDYDPGDGDGDGTGATATVDMGPVRLGDEVESPLPGTRGRLADVGNPHLVLLGDVDLDALDLPSLGRAGEQLSGAPVNVEVVRPGREGADLELRVFERGVGETGACGTGSCAAAAVAWSAGMVGRHVLVDNPGGRLVVDLGAAEDDPVTLGGPVRKIADVVVDVAFLDAASLDSGAPRHDGVTA